MTDFVGKTIEIDVNKVTEPVKVDVVGDEMMLRLDKINGELIVGQYGHEERVYGNDVVVTATDINVDYFATVKVTNAAFVDDAGDDCSILDSLTDVKYHKFDDTSETVITKAEYDAMTDPIEKAKYSFKEGALRFDLDQWKTTNRYYFQDKEFYTHNSATVPFGVTLEDLNNIKAGTFQGTKGYYGTYWAAFVSKYGSEAAAKAHEMLLSDLHIYRQEDGYEAEEITNDYLTAAGKAEDEMAYNHELCLETADRDVAILTNYVLSGKTDVYVNDTDYNVNNDVFTVTMNDNNEFEGTRFDEVAGSLPNDQDYMLAGGTNTMTFTGDFGSDTVYVEKGYGNKYNLNFVDGNGYDAPLVYTEAGKDLVISTDVSYYATFTPSEDTTWDSFTYKKGTEYTLELVQVKKSSNEAQLPSGTYTWGMVERDATASEKEAGYGDKISLFLDYTDINAGKVFGADIEFHEVRNGEDNIVSKSYLYGSTPLTAETFAAANEDWNDTQISGSVTIKDYLDADAVYTDGVKMLTVKANGTDIEGKLYDPAVAITKEAVTVTGSRLNEIYVSESVDEQIDLGTGADEIVFTGDYGDDTVKANKGEKLDLDFYGPVKYAVDGNDVVLSSDVSYYATFTPSEDTTWDSFTYKKGTEYTLELVQVKKSSNETQLPSGSYTWGMVERDATASEKEAGYGDKISLFLDYTDINAGKVFGADIKFHEVVNGYDREVSAAYLYGEDPLTAGTFATANKLWNDNQTSGSVTLEGYVKADPEAVIKVDGVNLAEHPFDAAYDSKTKTFSGTRLNEMASSTSDNEKFNLGTGSDSISFYGDFGTDKVTMNKDEELGLWFSTSVDNLNYKVSGKNLTISTDVSYYATFTPSENVTWDSFTYEKGKEYTLELVQVKKSSNETQLPSGTYTWGMVERDATKAETDAGYGDKISLFLDYTDINAGKVFGADIEFHKVVNGEDNVVTKAELYGTTPLTAESFATANEGWNYTQISGSVTVENFTSYKDDLRVNDKRVHFEVTPKNDVFTGTKNDDYAVSTDHDEKFDLKQGTDEIVFSGDFGDDAVKLTKGENLYMNFKDANGAYHDVVSEVVGKDLVLSTEESYYVTFTPSEDVTWDSFTYEEDTEYRLELVQVKKSSNETQLPSGTYTWGMVERDATKAETDAGYGDKISLFLDYTDINAGKVFGADLVFHKVVNGEDNIVSKSYLYGTDPLTAESFATVNEGWNNSQISGTVTLTDYAAKDLGATVYLNESDTAYRYMNVIDADVEAVKGKVNGTTGDDVILAGAYKSANGKGLTINSGSGNDNISGTAYKDTVKASSKVDEQATVREAAGANKVTFGKGNDKFVATDYSSNTVTANTGDNQFDLGSAGTNKVNAKNGSNKVEISAGVNTVKLGNASEYSTAATSWATFAHNYVKISGGQNKVTSGKGVDMYNILGGINNISSGDGADTFVIANGDNTIKTGNGNKTFAIADGLNTITTGKGDDTFNFVGYAATGKTVVKAGAGNDTFNVSGAAADSYMYLDGGKGTDTYNFEDLATVNDKTIIVNDSKGAILGLNDKFDLFFDVTLKKAGNSTIKSIGNEVLFTDAVDGDFEGGIDVKSFKAIDKVTIGESNYSVSLDKIAGDVAGWLANSKVYKSASEVFASENADDIAALVAVYANANDKYVDSTYKAI